MSVSIRGLDWLNANYYDGIVITQKEDNYIVNVRGKKNKFSMIKLSNKFSDRLNGLDDIDKIDNIVDYFLEYEKIIYIRDDDYINYYFGKYSSVRCFKNLSLQLNNSKMEQIFNKILRKYQMDRRVFVYDNSNINNYKFNMSYKSSYGFSVRDCIEFDLKCNDRKLIDFEFEFFNGFLEDKLSKYQDVATIEKKEIFNVFGDVYIDLGHYIYCCDLSIALDSAFVGKTQNLVDKHNDSLGKVKQLKLEGF